MAYELFEPFPDIRGVKNLLSKEVTTSQKITFEAKRGFKLGNINFMDASKGTGYFKLEHNHYGFKDDKKKFDDATEKPAEPKPFNLKYNNVETYFDTKFKNDDSLKIKTGTNKTVECNFTMKNLKFPGNQDCALAKCMKNCIESKNLQFNIHRDMASHHIKQLSFELSGKETNENLNLTVKNSGEQKSFKLVHNYPFNDNFKVKTTLIDDFMSNNTVDLKYRKKFWDNFSFQCFASMKWALGGELHDRTKKNQERQKNQDKSQKHEWSKKYITFPLVSVFQPEKMQFAFTYKNSFDNHTVLPFFGVVAHDNNKSSFSMGYKHDMDFENGWKVNYALLYKYDNFLNKLRSCNYLFDRTAQYQKVEGTENLTFGTELNYKFKNCDYLNSVTGKYVVNQQGLKVAKVAKFKGYGDLFDGFNFHFKANIDRVPEKNYKINCGVGFEFI